MTYSSCKIGVRVYIPNTTCRGEVEEGILRFSCISPYAIFTDKFHRRRKVMYHSCFFTLLDKRISDEWNTSATQMIYIILRLAPFLLPSYTPKRPSRCFLSILYSLQYGFSSNFLIINTQYNTWLSNTFLKGNLVQVPLYKSWTQLIRDASSTQRFPRIIGLDHFSYSLIHPRCLCPEVIWTLTLVHPSHI